MNDTPETDGEWNRIACYEHPQFEQGIAEFARKLERRLAEYAEDKARLAEMVLDAKSERDQLKENTIRPKEEAAGLLDKANIALRVKWVNALRAIVGSTMPKNKSGVSLVSDIDLILASDEQRLMALEKIK